MVLNYIWVGFFLIGFIVAVIRVVGFLFRDFFAAYHVFNYEDLNVFSAIVQSTFSMAETSVTISIYLIGVMSLWLGLMKIGEDGGAIRILSKAVGPFFHRLFPEVPKDHPANGSMLMNISANMLGLDNAATPLGLKAMGELQELNPQKEKASNAQIMFLVLNASGLTIIPVSIMGLRAAQKAVNPSDIFLPILIATFISTLAGLISVAIYQKINLFQRTILAYLGGATLGVALLIAYFASLPPDEIGPISSFVGNGIIFFIIVVFIYLAFRKKVNVFDSFIEGAKEGFGVAVKIIPYLVAMLVAIGVFRASGAMDMLLAGIRGIFDGINGLIHLLGFQVTIDTRFIEALPVALMKPLSGSGARGLMVEAMKTYGVDSFVGKLASTFQGSSETTFYVLAVYFGSVGIKNSRYAVTCALIADLAGVIAAISIAYIFFG